MDYPINNSDDKFGQVNFGVGFVGHKPPLSSSLVDILWFSYTKKG